MRTELVKGRFLLCGCILRTNQILAGQVWAPADGSNRTVTVESTTPPGTVTYYWGERGETKRHSKEAFAFQCRYCLVLPTAEIPTEFERKP